MALTAKMKEFIELMDVEAKSILRNSNQEELLKSFWGKMEKLQEILDTATKDELNHYCEKYDGFYLYMKTLEHLANACSDGTFNDILK